MEIDFTHRSYLELLGFVQSLGYAIGPFRDIPGASQYVLLRHDIDFSLEKAVEMAQLDWQAGVNSTFFILLTAPYYNPLSEQGSSYVRAIVAMGHEVGLHADLSGFDALLPEQQQARIHHWAATLGDIAGCEVTSIAQHRPASTGIRVKCPDFTDAYDDCYINEIGYITDSRRRFGHPDVHSFFREHPRSQLLTHPIWWHAEPKTRSQIFSELAAGMASSLQREILAEDARIEAQLNPPRQP